MSKQYPGGVISKTAPVPSGPYSDSTAPGIWTLEQQAAYAKLGQWPTQGNPNPSLFIENLFSTSLYTGTNSTQSIVNGIDLSTKGGMCWFKIRNTGTYNHALVDTARGRAYTVGSDITSSQYTSDAGNDLASFNTNGFTVGPVQQFSAYNRNGNTIVNWTFREQAKFFDVVTYTGTGTNRTVSHNLGSTPGCIITKKTSSTGEWLVYHRSQDNYAYTTRLNSTAGQGTLYTAYSATPTSTQFSVDGDLNDSGATYVAYLFAHNAGGFGLTGTDNVISCGSFTLDGSGNATVSLGYEPQWITIKKISGAEDWYTNDIMRGLPFPASNQYLIPNTAAAEGGGSAIAPSSTGFNITGLSTSGSVYIYIAIRRGPMAVPTSATTMFAPIARAGTSAATSISGGSFTTDTIIAKSRGTAGTPFIWASRLTGTLYLQSDSDSAQSGSVGTFPTNATWDIQQGIKVGGGADINGSSDTYINYFLGRAPSVFDVVSYTGDGTNGRQISHNLASAPEIMIFKRRNVVDDWTVMPISASNNIFLNTTAAMASNGRFYFGNNTTAIQPTSTYFTVSDNPSVNNSGNTYTVYLFATCAGVSKVGSYTGTGTTQTINCGFTAGSRFVMIKRTDSTGDWYVWDSARGIIAGNDPYLLLNSSAAEVTGTDYVDTAATGFEISSTAPAAINASGGTYIFLAIA